MTLQAMLTAINEAYPDAAIEQCFDLTEGGTAFEIGDVGDTLALFIGREVKDTWSEDASDAVQIAGVVRVLDVAIGQLSSVRALVSSLPAEQGGAS